MKNINDLISDLKQSPALQAQLASALVSTTPGNWGGMGKALDSLGYSISEQALQQKISLVAGADSRKSNPLIQSWNQHVIR